MALLDFCPKVLSLFLKASFSPCICCHNTFFSSEVFSIHHWRGHFFFCFFFVKNWMVCRGSWAMIQNQHVSATSNYCIWVKDKTVSQSECLIYWIYAVWYIGVFYCFTEHNNLKKMHGSHTLISPKNGSFTIKKTCITLSGSVLFVVNHSQHMPINHAHQMFY